MLKLRFDGSIFGVLGLAALMIAGFSASGYADVNDCGVHLGEPPAGGPFQQYDSPCNDFTDGPSSNPYRSIFSGNDSLSSVQAALILLGLPSDITLIGKTDDNPLLFNIFDSDGDPVDLNNGVGSGFWELNSGDNIVAYMTIKAGSSIRIFQYLPFASDGRYTSLGITVGKGNQPNVSHISFWTVDYTTTPEPASLALFAFGLAGYSAMRRRRRLKA